MIHFHLFSHFLRLHSTKNLDEKRLLLSEVQGYVNGER